MSLDLQTEVNAVVSAEPNKWTPRPGGQQKFFDDWEHRYVALAGGFYAGKTWAGARKLAQLHILNSGLCTGQLTFCTSLAVAPNFSLSRTVIVKELMKALDESGLRWRFFAEQANPRFYLPDLSVGEKKSEILIRSADAAVSIAGFSVGAVWVDEVARWYQPQVDGDSNAINPIDDPILQCDARLRSPDAVIRQFIMTFTHEGDATRVYMDFELNPKPDHVLYRASTSDNPTAADFALAMKNQMSEQAAHQYLDGFAMSITGNRMYPAFSEANIGELSFDPAFPLQLGIDFNISPGMHGIIGQCFPDGSMTAVKEIHRHRMNVKELADEVSAIWHTYGNGMDLEIYGDATGNSKWSGTGESNYEVLKDKLGYRKVNYRVFVDSTNPRVADRVACVNNIIKRADGSIKYRIDTSCTRLIEDLKRMKWDEKGEEDKRDRNLSHASSADGYRIAYLSPLRPGMVNTGHDSNMGSIIIQ